MGTLWYISALSIKTKTNLLDSKKREKKNLHCYRIKLHHKHHNYIYGYGMRHSTLVNWYYILSQNSKNPSLAVLIEPVARERSWNRMIAACTWLDGSGASVARWYRRCPFSCCCCCCWCWFWPCMLFEFAMDSCKREREASMISLKKSLTGYRSARCWRLLAQTLKSESDTGS